MMTRETISYFNSQHHDGQFGRGRQSKSAHGKTEIEFVKSPVCWESKLIQNSSGEPRLLLKYLIRFILFSQNHILICESVAAKLFFVCRFVFLSVSF
jgi:hypothetical protein